MSRLFYLFVFYFCWYPSYRYITSKSAMGIQGRDELEQCLNERERFIGGSTTAEVENFCTGVGASPPAIAPGNISAERRASPSSQVLQTANTTSGGTENITQNTTADPAGASTTQATGNNAASSSSTSNPNSTSTGTRNLTSTGNSTGTTSTAQHRVEVLSAGGVVLDISDLDPTLFPRFPTDGTIRRLPPLRSTNSSHDCSIKSKIGPSLLGSSFVLIFQKEVTMIGC